MSKSETTFSQCTNSLNSLKLPQIPQADPVAVDERQELKRSIAAKLPLDLRRPSELLVSIRSIEQVRVV